MRAIEAIINLELYLQLNIQKEKIKKTMEKSHKKVKYQKELNLKL